MRGARVAALVAALLTTATADLAVHVKTYSDAACSTAVAVVSRAARSAAARPPLIGFEQQLSEHAKLANLRAKGGASGSGEIRGGRKPAGAFAIEVRRGE